MATELERSHDELRAGIIVAAREIRRLNFGKRTNPVVVKLRELLRDARLVRRGGEGSGSQKATAAKRSVAA